MIDPTLVEQKAMEAALKPLGEFVTESGINRRLAEYNRTEVLALIEVVVTAYQEYMTNKTEINEEVLF